MIQVELTSSAFMQIFRFVERHNDYLTSMFYDTGLDGEEQIRGQYIDEGMALDREIYDIIQEKFARKLVAYEYIEDNIRLSVIRHRARLIFVKYNENDHVREIYDIQIFHK